MNTNGSVAVVHANGNGKPHAIPNGQRGSVVLVCTLLGLASEMRRVALPALDSIREAPELKKFVDDRRVAVGYHGATDQAAADQAAAWIQSKCHPAGVGVIDLRTELGFPDQAEAFLPWWEETTGMGECFGDGVEFLQQIERKTAWRRISPILDDEEPDDSADVRDPIGDIDPKAYRGVIGRLVQATQPETEANPVFVLLHLLAFFGATIGRGPHFIVSASHHHLNLFIGLIGSSGWSRKGTAADVARLIWKRVDPDFEEQNISDGLNSGAGLLYHLRDASTKTGSKGQPIEDPGVIDKRRVFLEEELGSVLKTGHRENDTLLDLLRKFFDGRKLIRSTTKDPTKVTGAHVGLIGHCTPEDLDIQLSDVDKANGTANRLMWFFGVRSKFLPSGGDVFSVLNDFLGSDLQELRERVEWAKKVELIRRSPKVEKWWEELYRGMNNAPPGRLGAFFVRAPIQVMRLASLYALMDRTAVIETDHLDAAMAIWRHSERSLRWIFKADLDHRAEKLLKALQEAPDGLTKRDIANRVFSKNMSTSQVDELLKRLLAYRILVREDPRSSGGRPAPHYRVNEWRT
jgi:hypothetical protein